MKIKQLDSGKRTAGLRLGVAGLVCLGVALSANADTASTKKKPAKHPAAKASSSKASHTKGKKSTGKKSRRVRGQQKIDGERARQIQDALVREHYLPEGSSGEWNQNSEAAMRKFQADHGWQTKEVPDSRALIALGLGPSNDHLLNPESAMTSMPVKSAANVPPQSSVNSQK